MSLSSADKPTIHYFTDILCVWAWISQRRIDQLSEEFAGQVTIRHAFVDVFGDTANRIGRQWADKGGYEGFGRHVIESAADFEEATVSDDIWKTVRPRSSAACHTYIKAAGLAHGDDAARQLERECRGAFFQRTLDVSDAKELNQLATDAGLNPILINEQLENGAALGALMADYQEARRIGVTGSPSVVMNDNRQTLFGNVGYRILKTNVEELLRRPANEASWC
ncbi:DsbA family oxidoreductase [Congregibacter sp.]|uniref:DsbA family oxidoreductase n=1 Tax=Congregibacter sp. TaxID=2744308 RepID=UPI003F6B2DDF